MVDTDVLTEKWKKQDLTKDDVREYLEENLEDVVDVDTDTEFQQLVTSLYDIYKAYHSGLGITYFGDNPFLTAVIMDSLLASVLLADEISKNNIEVFVEFLYTVAPRDYKEVIS